MLKLDRSKLAPVQLGRLGQVDTAVSLATTAVNWIRNLLTGSADPIPYIGDQNAAVAQFANVIQQYDVLKHGGTLTAQYINIAEQNIKTILAQFVAEANRINTSRSLQGARDVTSLANQIIAGMETDKLNLPSVSVLQNLTNLFSGPTTTTSGGIQTASTMGIGTVLLLGVAAWFFLQPKRRST